MKSCVILIKHFPYKMRKQKRYKAKGVGVITRGQGGIKMEIKCEQIRLAGKH